MSGGIARFRLNSRKAVGSIYDGLGPFISDIKSIFCDLLVVLVALLYHTIQLLERLLLLGLCIRKFLHQHLLLIRHPRNSILHCFNALFGS